MLKVLFLYPQFQYVFEFSQILEDHKVHHIKAKIWIYFSLISPGKKPNLSPASTAGLDKLCDLFFVKSIVRLATAKCFPVPAGPEDIIISLSLSALTYFFCFSDLGITDFLEF